MKSIWERRIARAEELAKTCAPAAELLILYARLAAFLQPEQVVSLTAFGGLMIATNIVNNALRVDLDEYLWPYRKGVTAGARPS